VPGNHAGDAGDLGGAHCFVPLGLTLGRSSPLSP
jgi:hypothetical protein